MVVLQRLMEQFRLLRTRRAETVPSSHESGLDRMHALGQNSETTPCKP